MYSRNVLIIIGLFVLALLLAIVTGVLFALGLLTTVLAPFFVPLAATFSLAIVLAIVGVAVIAASSKERENKALHRIICGCALAYLRPAAVSAVAALVIALIFSALVVVPILSGIIFGLITLALLFALFLLVAFIFCAFESSCHYCPCSEDREEQ